MSEKQSLRRTGSIGVNFTRLCLLPWNAQRLLLKKQIKSGLVEETSHHSKHEYHVTSRKWLCKLANRWNSRILFILFLKHPVPGDVKDRTLGLVGHQSDLLWQSPYFKLFEDMSIYTHCNNYVQVLFEPAATNIFPETLESWIPFISFIFKHVTKSCNVEHTLGHNLVTKSYHSKTEKYVHPLPLQLFFTQTLAEECQTWNCVIPSL